MLHRYPMLPMLLLCAGVAFFPRSLPAATTPVAQATVEGLSTPIANSAAARLSEWGPENTAMAQRAGLWDVTETVWTSPDAPAQTTRGLVAERRMIGSMLQETLRTGSRSTDPILRTDYQTFNRVEDRWDYVSMDVRAPVGIMPAWSFDRGDPNRVVLTFEPFAWVGSGPNVTGQMLRMQQIVMRQDADHDSKDQYFMMADGIGKSWLAHRYTYVRRH